MKWMIQRDIPQFSFASGTVWTASAHIITAVIGSGVLSLAWAIGQLGWIAGPTVMLLFSFVTYYSSTLLSDCYRTGDPVSGKRNYTYMDAVRSILGINSLLSSAYALIALPCFSLFYSVSLCFVFWNALFLTGGFRFKICGLIQYLNLFGITVGYTIAASISMMWVSLSHKLVYFGTLYNEIKAFKIWLYRIDLAGRSRGPTVSMRAEGKTRVTCRAIHTWSCLVWPRSCSLRSKILTRFGGSPLSLLSCPSHTLQSV